jgi:membrane protein DedA with SNARE-associated domain
MEPGAQHVPAFIQALAPIVNQYGYLAIGGLVLLEDFGVPAPGETVLIAAALFAGLGHLNIFLVFIVGFAGAVIGDNIGFGIGNYGGKPLIRRYGKYVFLTPERVKKATGFFERHGGKVIIIARFVEGLRQANGIVAGLSAMRWPRFLTFNAIGAALWTVVWSVAGYFGGSHIQLFLRYQLYFAIAVGAAIVGFITYEIYRHQRTRQR